MPDKLKAKVFTILIFLKLPTSMKLFSGVSGLTQVYSFQLCNEQKCKKSNPIPRESVMETAMQSTMLEIIYRL